jgi:hypothetical protein
MCSQRLLKLICNARRILAETCGLVEEAAIRVAMLAALMYGLYRLVMR